MNVLMPYEDINGDLDIFTKCFINLNNLSDGRFISFKCTVWNQPREGMNNSSRCWRFDFYDSTPFNAMEKAFKFVIKNREDGFVKDYDECMKLRNEISK